jgi:hypothetical protein
VLVTGNENPNVQAITEAMTFLLNEGYNQLGLITSDYNKDKTVKIFLLGLEIYSYDKNSMAQIRDDAIHFIRLFYNTYKEVLRKEPIIGSKEYENMTLDEQSQVILELAKLQKAWYKLKWDNSQAKADNLAKEIEELKILNKLIEIYRSKYKESKTTELRGFIDKDIKLKQILIKYGYDISKITYSDLSELESKIKSKIEK